MSWLQRGVNTRSNLSKYIYTKVLIISGNLLLENDLVLSISNAFKFKNISEKNTNTNANNKSNALMHLCLKCQGLFKEFLVHNHESIFF